LVYYGSNVFVPIRSFRPFGAQYSVSKQLLMDTLSDKIGINRESSCSISKGCVGQLAEITFSGFSHYSRTNPLFDLFGKVRFDLSLIQSLSQEYPELEEIAKAVAAHPPTFQSESAEPFHKNISQHLMEEGRSEGFIFDVLNEMTRLEKLEPYFHQEQIISGKIGEDGPRKAFLSGIAKTDDELRQLKEYSTDAELRFRSIELDRFHKSYPAFVLRFVNSQGTKNLVEKVLEVRRELEIAGKKFSAFAGNSGTITEFFETEDMARSFMENLGTSNAEPVIGLLPKRETTYDDFESFVHWSLFELLVQKGTVVKHVDGKWSTIFPERFYIQIPVDNLILVNEISESLFPFLMKTSAQPQKLACHLEKRINAQNVSILQCDRNFLTLFLSGAQTPSDAQESLQGLLKEFDFKLLPGETYSCTSGTVVRLVAEPS
jgi:hypothetical protein